MKLWIDDIRPAPDGSYTVVRSVNACIWQICECEQKGIPIDLLDLDHDAGDYAANGGDYIKILDWMERTGRNIPIRLHSMNPVGRENMRRIIQKNGWIEI